MSNDQIVVLFMCFTAVIIAIASIFVDIRYLKTQVIITNRNIELDCKIMRDIDDRLKLLEGKHHNS